MASVLLRLVGIGFLIAFLVWALAEWKENLRQEGRQEVTQAIQQENTKELQQERETSDRVLVERQKKGAVHDATSKQTQKQLYEAKPTAYDIDRPLPDSIANPLRLQWEAINCGQGGEDATACRVADGKAHP